MTKKTTKRTFLSMNPSFTPEYRKPDAPGLSMNFDNSISMYHVVKPSHAFQDAAEAVFGLLRQAQTTYPDWPRVFYVDIQGHEGEHKGFDSDFYEFQQEFWFATIAHFVTAFELPMTGGLINPKPQRNDVPDVLSVRAPGKSEGGEAV